MRLGSGILGLLLFASAPLAAAGEARPQRRASLSYYYGQFSDTNLGDILLTASTDYRGDYLHAFSYSRPLALDLMELPLEAEGQVVRHSGRTTHMEFNGALVARWQSSGGGFSLAAGEGLSLATRNPDLENPRRSPLSPGTQSEYSRNLLNFLLFEAEAAIPLDAYQPRVFLRVHHRSGGYGLLCPPTCGSNYVAYGLRFSL
ncbi:MAG: hypothetical protein K1X75_06965 [Leptospirales bacterium]|nr:hypothetical protein [Leptospirales bacterium]